MIRFLRRLVTLRHTYSNPIDQRRATSLLYITAGILVLGVVVALINFLPDIVANEVSFTPIELVIVAVPVMVYTLYEAIQNGYLRVASYLLIFLTFFFTALSIASGGANIITAVSIMVPLLLSGLLIGWRTVSLVAMLIVMVFLQGMATTVVASPDANTNDIFRDYGVVIFLTILIGGITILFGNNVQSLVTSYAQRLTTLRKTTLAAATLDTTQSETNRMRAVIQMLTDDFKYSFVQIVLLDNFGLPYAALNNNMPISSDPRPLGQGTEYDEEIIELVYRNVEPRHLRPGFDELIPGSRSGVLVPMFTANRVIGILDVQSDTLSEISAEEVANIRILANELAGSVHYTRTVRELQSALDQQELIVSRQTKRLEELERAQKRSIIEQWSTYLEQRGLSVSGFKIDHAGIAEETENSDELLSQVMQTGEMVVKTEGDYQHISVPIVIGGQPMGAMSFDVPTSRPLNPRELDLMRSIVDRMALAMENQRLLEQSQSQAERKSLANAIASELLARTSVDDVLQVAAENFNTALGAIQTRIHIATADTDSTAEEVS